MYSYTIHLFSALYLTRHALKLFNFHEHLSKGYSKLFAILTNPIPLYILIWFSSGLYSQRENFKLFFSVSQFSLSVLAD